MLLTELVDYTYRLNLPPPLYTEAPVRYIIELDESGRLLNPHPTDTVDHTSPQTKRGQRRFVPQVVRSVGIKPLLLVDKADYTLGLGSPDSKPARVAEAHRQYVALVERCFKATGEATVGAVLAFLGSDPVAQLELEDTFDYSALITFRIDGVFPIELPSVQAFWAMENDPEARATAGGGQATVMQCLVCGQERPVLERLQGKIKGIPGGQMAGTSIISANAEAFESYGLKASLIAPTCASCGERFTKGANELIAGQESHIVLGNAVFIFWTQEPTSFSFRSFISDPKPEQVRELINSVRTGKGMQEPDRQAFYASALSASGGRAVVRDWIDTTVGEVQRQLTRWFAAQEIVDAYGEEAGPLGLYALAAATVRDLRTDLTPPTPRALLHAAMTGTPLPSDLLYQAVRRNRAEQSVTRQRAALIKLVLFSRQLIKEGSMVELDRSKKDAAYLCGRLLAVLERAQRLAVPGIKATIVDRFYGTASSAPASVFGRLLRGVQANLSKLERDMPGAYNNLQRQLEEIQHGLSNFPRTLTLQQQGLFALGYYHQRADDRSQAREAKERRTGAGVASASSATDAEDTTIHVDTDSQEQEETPND